MNELSNYFHILNPSARHRAAVKRFFKNIPADHYCWVERKSHPTHLETIVEWAVREKKGPIAVWAGDGSFNRVVNELFSRGVLPETLVALIPVGTANDFARKMGWHCWTKWAKTLFSNEAGGKLFDLGLLSAGQQKRIFVNNAGFGRNPSKLGKGLSNPLKDILDFREHKIQVEWKTGHAEHFETLRAFFGIVFNAPFFNNGMYFDSDIAPDDGMLNGFLVPPQSKIRLLWRLVGSRFGKSLNDPQTFRMDADSLEIDSDSEMFPQVDGEKVLHHAVNKLKFEVLKGKLKLALPSENNANEQTIP